MQTCVYSQQELLYFTGSQLPKLRFIDTQPNIFSAYNTENQNNLCPASFILIGKSCYRLMADSVYDWNQAKSQCLLMNSNLAYFSSQQELDLVRSYLNTLFLTNDVWIGGRSQYSSWYWDFNNNQIPTSFLTPNWAPGKPSNNQQQNAMLLSRTNGYLFTNDAPERRSYSLLCRKNSFLYDSTNTLLSLVEEIKAIDPIGQPIIGFKFLTNVTQTIDLTKVLTPSISTYSNVFNKVPLQYGKLYTGSVYPYQTPFILSICGDLTMSQIKSVMSSVKNVWLNTRPEFQQCNCFEVFVVSAEKFTDVNNQVATQLSYVARANQLMIEAKSNGPLPSTAQIFSAIGLNQCQSRAKRSALLDLNIAGADLTDLDQLTDSVQNGLYSVRPDFQVNKQIISLSLVSNNDALDITSRVPVTQLFLNVSVNGAPVDFYTQTLFDYRRLVDELNYQNENSSLTFLLPSTIYSRNYFFSLFSDSLILKKHYRFIESEIIKTFVRHYPQFMNRNASASIIWQEEYLNELRKIVYGLSVLISVDNEPVEQLITIDRSIFANLRGSVVSYLLYLPKKNDAYLQPLSNALTFFSSSFVSRTHLANFEALFSQTLYENKLSKKISQYFLHVFLHS